MHQRGFMELAHTTINAAGGGVDAFNAILTPESEYRYLYTISAPNIAEITVVKQLREAGTMRAQLPTISSCRCSRCHDDSRADQAHTLG